MGCYVAKGRRTSPRLGPEGLELPREEDPLQEAAHTRASGSERETELLGRIQKLEESLTRVENKSRVAELEQRTSQLVTEVATLRHTLETYQNKADKSPPPRRNSCNNMRRVQSTTLSDMFDLDSVGRLGQRRLTMTSRTSAPKSPGADSMASVCTNASIRPKRRHIIHQMSEIEAYGKGLNPHDLESTRTYSDSSETVNNLTPGSSTVANKLSCIHSVSDVYSDCDCEPAAPT